MSIEGIKVVLVHQAETELNGWDDLLTELCDGVPPVLVSSSEIHKDLLNELSPHRIIVLAPMDSEIYSIFMQSIPVLAAGSSLESFMAAFGGRCVSTSTKNENYLMHDGVGLWTGFTDPLKVFGYPCTAPDQSDLPAELVVTAWNDEGVALALRHRQLPTVAWNIHPADLGEELGRELLLAFLEGTYLTGTPTGPPEV